MVIPYRSAGVAGCARLPGCYSLRLALSAIAVAAAIASSPALADGKNKSANFGPVVPNITTGMGNFNRQANFVVASIPGAGLGLSKVETGNSGPGPSALPVTAVANGAGVKSGSAAGNDAGVHLISRENGQLLLAAGQSVEIAEPGSPNLRMVVTAPVHHSLDIGKIVAIPERSGIYATLAAQAGPPRANGVTLASDGRVMLTSTGHGSARGHGSKSDDSQRHAIHRDRSQVSVSPSPGSKESDLNASAASVQDTASHAVTQQTDADRDTTLKTGGPVIGNTSKRDSSKSKSSACS